MRMWSNRMYQSEWWNIIYQSIITGEWIKDKTPTADQSTNQAMSAGSRSARATVHQASHHLTNHNPGTKRKNTRQQHGDNLPHGYSWRIQQTEVPWWKKKSWSTQNRLRLNSPHWNTGSPSKTPSRTEPVLKPETNFPLELAARVFSYSQTTKKKEEEKQSSVFWRLLLEVHARILKHLTREGKKLST